ncbi:hypothetical protein L7F22_006905 [Adiantum nelumboides]|nr:hypothetical protein [Adiantum nelumboides]
MATRSEQLNWQEIHLSEDEASAQGTHAVRFLVQQVEKAQNNSLLRPMLNNLMRAHGLQLLNYEPPTQDPSFQEASNEGNAREERGAHFQNDASSGRSRSPSRRIRRPLEREDNSLRYEVQESESKCRRSPSCEVSSSPSLRGRKREREHHARRRYKPKQTPSPSSSPSKGSSLSSSSSSDGYSSKSHHKRRKHDTHCTWKLSRKLQKFKEGGKIITFQTYDGSYVAIDKVLFFIQQYCAGLTEDIRAYVNDQKLRTIAEVIHRSKVAMIFFFLFPKELQNPLNETKRFTDVNKFQRTQRVMVTKGRKIRCHTRAQENYLLKRWNAIRKKIGAISVEKQDIFLAHVLSDNNVRKLHKPPKFSTPLKKQKKHLNYALLGARLGIQTEEMGTALEASGAFKGQHVPVTPLIGKLRVHVQGYVDQEEFCISPLATKDVILGAPWFHRLAAVLEYPTRTISFKFRNRDISIHTKDRGSTIPIVSHASLQKSMKSNLFVYMIFAQESKQHELSVEQKDQQEFLNSFKDCFADEIPKELPPSHGEDDHKIELIQGSSPPNRPPYRVSYAQQEEILTQVNELLEKGLVRSSSSLFCSPVLLVQKKDGSYSMCIDYRALNKQTIKNRLPVPRIEDIFDRLQGSTYYSRIDLKSGYHQIRIVPEDIHKTAFCTQFGLYEYVVMPFGLTNAPATFNRLMENIFCKHSAYMGVFFDDIIVHSQTLEEHKKHLQSVFDELQANRLFVNGKKSEFFMKEIKYLGHIISKEGIRMDPEKLRVIDEWPEPGGLLGHLQQWVMLYLIAWLGVGAWLQSASGSTGTALALRKMW